MKIMNWKIFKLIGRRSSDECDQVTEWKTYGKRCGRDGEQRVHNNGVARQIIISARGEGGKNRVILQIESPGGVINRDREKRFINGNYYGVKVIYTTFAVRIIPRSAIDRKTVLTLVVVERRCARWNVIRKTPRQSVPGNLITRA